MLNGLRSAAMGLALSTTMALSANAADVTLKFAGTLPTEHFGHAILENMAKEIGAAGVGITVKYFPASQLGSGEELFEDAKLGNVDLVHATVYAQADTRLEIASLPFLVTTIDELRSVYGDPASKYNTIIREILGDHGIQYLSNIGEGLIGVVASKAPSNAAAFADQGMNIRVWSSEVTKATMEKLGYRTTTMSWAEVFPAVQAGTIDGAICCTAEWAYTTFAVSGVGNTYVPYNAFVESTQIYMNQAKWASLNAEQQAVIQAAAAKAANAIIDQAWERTEGFIAKLKEKGWNIVDLTQEQRDAIKAKIVAEVWPTVGKIVGQELVDRLNAN
ncbi:MAG: transporter [Rhizobiales bacterium]|nr:transporter [Hyphomicrobiales bacterium]